jgi:hypothetical protein
MRKKKDAESATSPMTIIAELRKAALKYRSNAQPGKRRFGLHKYLKRVYRIYWNLSSKRNLERIIREVAELAEIVIRRGTHPIRTLIDVSVGAEDPKQISRWVQALLYVYSWKLPPSKVEWCLRSNGGIYGCARKQAILNKAARAKRGGWL